MKPFQTWWFWDETGSSPIGPWKSEEAALEAAKLYGKYLNTELISNSLELLRAPEWEAFED